MLESRRSSASSIEEMASISLRTLFTVSTAVEETVQTVWPDALPELRHDHDPDDDVGVFVGQDRWCLEESWSLE